MFSLLYFVSSGSKDSRLLKPCLPKPIATQRGVQSLTKKYFWNMAINISFQELHCYNLCYYYASILNSVDPKLFKPWPPDQY